ncbi:MAG: hypothetical protein EZS28_028439 [Streblomastix strix]|uniref:Uncharacterized protein n=1 Tax=Streblomastix strix TaxID=222440 RepID=A0A5J4V1X2_9EUKA|nr:MAG: hypothetical protein EZS28_028439 [Streblomastix strix]
MEKSTYRPDQIAQSAILTGSDAATIIPRLILDLESDNNNLHAPALRQLLEIMLDNGENKDLTSKYKLMPLLNKFAGNVEKNEEFVLSSTIQHVIGVRNGNDNKVILAEGETQFKEKDEKIHQLEESNKHLEESNKHLEESNKVKDEEMRRKDFELQREKKRADEAEQRIHQLEQENKRKDVENLKLIKELEKIKIEYPQVIPHEFNVLNSLTGLGPDILLLILEGFIDIDDAIQYVGVNKKTLNLKNQARFIQIIEKLKRHSDIHNPDPRDIELSDDDANMMRISKKQDKSNTVSLTQVLEDGIWQLETEFNNSHNADAGIGIVRDSYNIPADTNPALNPHTQNMAFFIGKGWTTPMICYKGIHNYGMSGFGDNQILRFEFDSEKGTLFLFVDSIQQELYISRIKEKVRFFIFMYHAGSQCTIRSLKKLSAPTSGHVANEYSVEW